ncbi:AAA family ATPase [Streptomyces coeruleorubidus]|uniref:AAA family ATPase n=1 Tax=Streptomyces coeruleorubidus TaxID=116188 RepID=UPI0033C03CF3
MAAGAVAQAAQQVPGDEAMQQSASLRVLDAADETVRAQLMELLRAGRSIVLDHGLWRRSDRDEWKKTVRAVGGRPLLVYLPASKEVLLRRLAARNQRRDANALTVTPEALDDFFARFEPPTADEDAVTYNGDVEVIRSVVR